MTRNSPRIALFGSGPEAQRWAWALAEHASLLSGSLDRTDAVALAPGSPEPELLASEAAKGRLPVLWACGSTSKLGSIQGRSSTQEPLLHVYEPFQQGRAFGLLQRFLRGPEPFWQPSYLRLLVGSSAGLEDASVEALAMVDALLGLGPERVSSQTCARAVGEPSALFINVDYRQGPVLQLAVTLGKAERQLVVATQEHRLTLDGDRLSISPVSEHGRERVLCAEAPSDHLRDEARTFVDSVKSGRSCAGNAQRWQRAVRTWRSAEQSRARGKPVWIRDDLPVRERSPARVISWRGGQSRRLKVVA